MYKFTCPITQVMYNALASLLDSGEYYSFDRTFGKACLIKKDVASKSFGLMCKTISSKYGMILHNTHNTKLLDFYFEYIKKGKNYHVLRRNILDYSLLFGIVELWNSITIDDIKTAIKIGHFHFMRKYYFRCYQTNNHQFMGKLLNVSEKYINQRMMKECIKWFENDKLRFMFMLLEDTFKHNDIEVIELFTYDEVFDFDKYRVFDSFMTHTTNTFLEKILYKKDNFLTKKCIVRISSFFLPYERDLLVFFRILSSHNIINDIVFDVNSIDHLITKMYFAKCNKTVRKNIDIINIIINKPGLNIPKKIFCSNTNSQVIQDEFHDIRSNLFHYRIMLPFIILRDHLLPEICSTIINLLVV